MKIHDRITESFDFTNSRGLTLSGLVDRPAGIQPRAWGIFGPCFTCVKESHGASKICRALAERGIGMLRFDFTGLGKSGGDFADTHISSRVDDILSAARALGDAHAAPQLLIGHSMGGLAALAAAHDMPSLKLLATVGGPQDGAEIVAKWKAQGIMTPDEDGSGHLIDVLGISHRVAAGFEEDLNTHGAVIPPADLPLYIFHAPNDKIVSFKTAETLHARIPRSRLIPLSGSATHLFERGTEDAGFVAETLAGTLIAGG